MATPIAFDIVGRDKGATAAFDKIAKKADETGRKLKGSLSKSVGEKEGKQLGTRFGVGMNGAIGSAVSRSAGIFAAGFATIKVGGFLKDAISQASDLGETTSKVRQIFGPAAKDILKFSKTAATALGQTQQAALDANATFGTFGKSAGLQGKELSGFTTKLTSLAGDLASFNNTSPEQAIEAIGAALRGESEPIRAYGVLLDDASLRQEALSQGLVKTTKEALTPQNKVLAAQALIMKQTTTAQGDFARTSGGLANQQRILSARFTDLKMSIGAVALPMAVKLFTFLNDKGIPAVTGAIDVFKGLGNKIAKAIGPIDVTGVASSIVSGAKDWATSLIGGFKSGVEKGNWKPLGAALGAGIVEALHGLTAGADKLGAALGALIDKVDWDKLGTKISGAVTGLLKAVDWKKAGDALGDGIVKIIDTTTTLGTKLGTAFKTLIGKIDWRQIGSDSTTAIIGFVEGVDWPQVTVAFGKAVLGSLKVTVAVKNAIVNSSRNLVIGIAGAYISELLKLEVKLGGWMQKVGGDLVHGLWSGITGAMKGVGGFLKKTLIDPIVNWVKSGFGIHSPSTVFAGIGRDLILGLKNGAVATVSKVTNWFAGLPGSVVRWIGNVTRTLAGKGSQLLQGLWTAGQEKWAKIGPWLSGLPGSAGRWIGNVSKALMQKGRDIISGFWSGMWSRWGDVTKWVGGIAAWIRDHKGPISLDSRLLIPAGQAIMSGFLKGLQSGAGPAWAFVKSVGGKTKDAVAEVYGWIRGVGWPAVTGAFTGGAGANIGQNAALGKIMATSYGWTGPQWDALYQLWQHESGWNNTAQNPTSTAYGIAQFLNSTWGSVGATKTSDPSGQIAAGLRYIANAYGSPLAAWSAWQSRSPHWYEKGTPWVPNDQLAYLHKGEAVVPAYANRRPMPASGRGDVNVYVTVTGQVVDPIGTAQKIEELLAGLKKVRRGRLAFVDA